eukprot:4249953-Karenia_brevis.AAC.1
MDCYSCRCIGGVLGGVDPCCPFPGRLPFPDPFKDRCKFLLSPVDLFYSLSQKVLLIGIATLTPGGCTSVRVDLGDKLDVESSVHHLHFPMVVR